MQLIPVEKIFSNRDSIRKAREAFLISKVRKIDPNGPHIREETYWISLYYLESFPLLLVFEFKVVVTDMFYHIFSSITSTSIYYIYIYIYMYIEAIQCKLSLYLKKGGLASRNIVHH